MLTEEQYKALCANCDSILVADDATMERIAIPWLHVLREHPVFLTQYEHLFTPRRPLKRLFNYWRRVVVNVALWFRLVWRVVRSSGRLWYGSLPKCESVDVVFISHLVSLSQLADQDDFYFGKVPAELVRQGKSVLLVLINHTAAIGAELERSLEVSPIPRVVIPSGLSPKEEFRIWRRAADEAHKLRHAAQIEEVGLRKMILRRASAEATANNTKTALRIARWLVRSFHAVT
jgi:hypothetical protein